MNSRLATIPESDPVKRNGQLNFQRKRMLQTAMRIWRLSTWKLMVIHLKREWLDIKGIWKRAKGAKLRPSIRLERKRTVVALRVPAAIDRIRGSDPVTFLGTQTTITLTWQHLKKLSFAFI